MLKVKTIVGLIITILVLSGCAAGMANVHRSNVDMYTTLLVELGPKSEDNEPVINTPSERASSNPVR
jgi:PBP1b-binding outer membrane lipoprotein LpoB